MTSERSTGDGYLTITDRKKDIIITSVGKNIAPQRIETLLRTDPAIKEALVYGSGRAHLVALIVPDAEVAAQETNEATLHGIIERRIREKLKGLARFEQIRRFALIEDSITLEGGELTPTLKVKRELVGKRYSSLIEALYDGGDL